MFRKKALWIGPIIGITIIVLLTLTLSLIHLKVLQPNPFKIKDEPIPATRNKNYFHVFFDNQAIEEHLLASIEQASERVLVATFVLGLNSVESALIHKSEDARVVAFEDKTKYMQVEVKVLADEKSNWYRGEKRGIYREYYGSSTFHNKFWIIDNEICTGSWNVDESSMDNFENMICTNDPEVVKEYVKEFREVWEFSI